MQYKPSMYSNRQQINLKDNPVNAAFEPALENKIIVLPLSQVAQRDKVSIQWYEKTYEEHVDAQKLKRLWWLSGLTNPELLYDVGKLNVFI